MRSHLLTLLRLLENKSPCANQVESLPPWLALFINKFPVQLAFAEYNHVLVPVLAGLTVHVSADLPRPSLPLPKPKKRCFLLSNSPVGHSVTPDVRVRILTGPIFTFKSLPVG